MNAMRRTALLIVILPTLLNVACQKACVKDTPAQEKTATPQEEKIATKEVAKNSITRFDALKLDNLSRLQIDNLTTLFNEEVCPCGCPKTFAQCLQMKSGCKPGVLLAQWTADHLRSGAPETYLFKFVSEEINAGYLSEPKNIDTKNAYSKGNPAASVVIVEFADFECPACKLAALEMKAFMKKNSDVKLYFMHFPLSAHVNAERAAIAAEAAGKQGKFWEMHDLLFAENGALTDGVIKTIAQKIFNAKQMAQYEKDLADPTLLQKVKAHREYAANEMKLVGTPTFMFNGRPYNLSSSRDGYQLRYDLEKLRTDINCQAE